MNRANVLFPRRDGDGILCVTLKLGDIIEINGGEILIAYTEIKGKQIRLKCLASKNISIKRVKNETT